MKKLVCLLMFVLGVIVFADTTISISATVLQELTVSVNPAIWELTLDNSGNEINNTTQAMLTVMSSKKNYTISFSSANNGIVKAGSEEIPYFIKVDTSSWSTYVTSNSLSDYTQLTTTKSIVFKNKTPIAGKEFPIGFKIDSYTDLYMDDVYSDTITVIITSS